jgi:hypothetical protein
MAQKPSVGRIVHFVHPASSYHTAETVCVPAIIVELAHPDRGGKMADDVILQIFTRNGMASRTASRDEVQMLVGTWHWPEIV